MLLVYDDENVLHITNDNGLRWNYQKTQKPQFSFDYDALFYCPFDDETEYVLNGKKEPLSEEHISEIEEYIKCCPILLAIALEVIPTPSIFFLKTPLSLMSFSSSIHSILGA